MAAIWGIPEAQRLAKEYLSGLAARWAHVQRIAEVAASLTRSGLLPDAVASAAWLHDIGYAPSLAQTGFHPLDGALFLQGMEAPDGLVALVAHHTGAPFEAEERGLVSELEELPSADPVDLDALTLLDLVVGPSGELTTPDSRIDEILTRYGYEDPVHRAVTRSRTSLLASAERARAQLGLSDEWPLDVAEGVLES